MILDLFALGIGAHSQILFNTAQLIGVALKWTEMEHCFQKNRLTSGLKIKQNSLKKGFAIFPYFHIHLISLHAILSQVQMC